MIRQEVETFFGQDSPLRQANEQGFRYEVRPQQSEMALAVASAMDDGVNLCVEAPTGVGKTFAYLVPALYQARQSEKCVIISTHTINLQEQIIHRDIPMLERMLDSKIDAVVAKGRTNYLCLRRYTAIFEEDQAILEFDGSLGELTRLQKWASHTTTGDYGDIPRGVSPSLWHQVCCERGACLGGKCDFFKRCFLQRAKRRLQQAEIVIANHAKFFTSLAVDAAQQNLANEDENREAALPDYAAVILDEGHTLEDAASNHLGLHADTFVIRRLLGRLYHTERKTGILANVIYAREQESVVDCTRRASLFFERLLAWLEPQQVNPLRYFVPNHIQNYLDEPLQTLLFKLKELVQREDDTETSAELKGVIFELEEQALALNIFFTMERPDCVYWFEREGRQLQEISMNIVPIDIAQTLREMLFAKAPVIVTSATLAVNGDIGYFQKRVGCPDSRSLILDSPFDFQRQVKLFCTRRMPDPKDRDAFEAEASSHLRHFLKQTGGRAFVLFTSYLTMNHIAEAMQPFFEEENIRLLVQGGDLSPRRMLEEFRKDGHAVIFGNSSFWTGVDVPGDALSNVIITRLPFAVPDHPLVFARSQRIEQEGRSSFMDYSVPEAVLKFRQGVGRLIRTKEDTGIIVILDSRVLNKRYGAMFLHSIPQCPMEEF
ncbi:MAG: DEAD/DEAH box helicase [Victivallales bacterium]|nr:DEAD/DEAH box helicase [Victivallales bacterium]